MKIGYDAKRAFNNRTGLGNYSRLVISRMADSFNDDIILFSPRKPDNRSPILSTDILSHPNVKIQTRPEKFSLIPDSAWRTFSLSKIAADRCDVFHGLSNELPVGTEHTSLATVLTMHDVIYRRMPECYSAIDRKLYDLKYSRSCRAADRIIAISQRTADDIVELYGVDPKKIDIIYQGCDPIFYKRLSPDTINNILTKRGLKPGYVIQVGTIEARKNLELTMRAIGQLPGRQLVVVGRGKDYLKRMHQLAAELAITDRVTFLHDVRFDELPAIYQGACAVAYPSKYEGFGIPVIEGIASGQAVVAATGSCLEEAGGPGAIYVNPNDVRAMRDALDAILSNGSEIEKMRQEGQKYISRFASDRMAQLIHDVYEKAIIEKHRKK